MYLSVFSQSIWAYSLKLLKISFVKIEFADEFNIYYKYLKQMEKVKVRSRPQSHQPRGQEPLIKKTKSKKWLRSNNKYNNLQNGLDKQE